MKKIKYTSKGLYGIDIFLYDDIESVTENVYLLDFDKIMESLKAELQEEFHPADMKQKDLSIAEMFLSYKPYFEDENITDEYTYIPVWTFIISGGNGEVSYSISVNAMDGTVLDMYE